MPWCPKCQNEYTEGIKVCADCGTELVESLEEMKSNSVIFGEQEQMERLKEFLLYSGIRSAYISYDEKEGVYELYVSAEDRKKAVRAVAVFLKQEEEQVKKNEIPETDGNIGEPSFRQTYKGAYQSSEKRAEENRSSGYLLLVIGGMGLAVLILLWLEVIRLPVVLANKYMMYGVMGALFLLFFIMGIVSLKSSKVWEKNAEKENSLTREIKKWCDENLTPETVDRDLFGEENLNEELKYFKRVEKMKQMITHQFMNLDEGFLDAFIDDYYPVVFEQK